MYSVRHSRPSLDTVERVYNRRSDDRSNKMEEVVKIEFQKASVVSVDSIT